MKTVYLGKANEYDVVYDIVTEVRHIEEACGAEDTTAPPQFKVNGERLLSDLLFHYKNSQLVREKSQKQISTELTDNIKHHLKRIAKANASANDNHVQQYQTEMNEYLHQLARIQSQLVDIPEWHDLRECFKQRMSGIDIKAYPVVGMLLNLLDSLNRMNSSQSEKIHKAIDMIVKSYLMLIKQTASNTSDILMNALKAFLESDLNIDLAHIDTNQKIITLALKDKKKNAAFNQLYGKLTVSNGS